jgi:hypothetical protein
MVPASPASFSPARRCAPTSGKEGDKLLVGTTAPSRDNAIVLSRVELVPA